MNRKPELNPLAIAMVKAGETNASFNRFHQTNASFAEVSKKVMDIGGKCLKAGGYLLQFLKTSLPVINLFIALVGTGLKAYALMKDKRKPKWLRGLVLSGMVIVAGLSIATLLVSVSFPGVALLLSFIAIGAGVAFELIDFSRTGLRFLVSKYNLPKALKKDYREKIEDLNLERSMLFKQLTAKQFELTYKKSSTLEDKIKKIKQQLIKKDKKMKQLGNVETYVIQKHQQKRKVLNGALFGLSACLVGSLFAVLGIFLVNINPLLLIPLIALGFAFDAYVLRRHYKNWEENKVKEEAMDLKWQTKGEQLTNESLRFLKKEHRQQREHFNQVCLELRRERRPLKMEHDLSQFQAAFFQKKQSIQQEKQNSPSETSPLTEEQEVYGL